jgi:transposase
MHREMNEDLKHCPENLTGDAKSRARQADIDARRLIEDIRDLDPRQIWGRLNRYGHSNPQRLLALAVDLATKVDLAVLDEPGPAPWTAPIGGTAVLHPDYGARRPIDSDAERARRDAQIEEYLRTEMTHAEIARRTGASASQITRVASKTGLTRPRPDTTELDNQVGRLREIDGLSVAEVAVMIGICMRAVQRAHARVRARREAA